MTKVRTSLAYIFLGLGSLACLYPLIFMMISATHASGDILNYPPPFIPGDFLGTNYNNLQERIPIVTAFWNSVKIAVTFTILNIFVCSTAGYALAKFDFKYKNFIFTIILITMMLPGYARLIPLYRMMNNLGLHNSHLAIILPDIAGAFGIFLMRQNFYSVPSSLIESARIDGAGEWRIFFQIVLPIMIPSISALAIYTFMTQWSNFTWPLIVLSTEDQYTLPVVLSTLKGATRVDYGQIMVGASFAVMPILITFFFLQKYFIAGMTSGAVKE